MKFDVVIGNPPYQISDGGGTGDSAVPVYDIFIEQAKEIKPEYISMITPSKWMKGGRGLNNFRRTMMEDTRLKYIKDYQNAKDIFPSVDLDGGVSYFIWAENYDGPVEYTYTDEKGYVNRSNRYLKTGASDTVIRDYRQYSIIKKIYSKDPESFSKIVSSRNPFGFNSNLFNSPESYPNTIIKKEAAENYCLIYGVIGNKGGAKRKSRYINRSSIEKGEESINRYKLFFSKAFSTNATVPPKVIKGFPGSLCTETFLKIGDFDTEKEMNNCLDYIHTKFFRALLFFNRHSLNISRNSFSLIPLLDFSKSWTDQELYETYNLSTQDIKYIEENIKEME